MNVDIGEGCESDRELLKVSTSANICCGSHAGSRELTKETALLCSSLGVRIGAHPGYPDRENFGRKSWDSEAEFESGELFHNLVDQVRLLEPVAKYLKPHGALYNDSCQPGLAGTLVASLLTRFHLPLMGMPGTFHETLAAAAGHGFIREGFADRRYTSSGLLVPRSVAGAVLDDPDEVAAQAVELAERVDSICLHGDGPNAVTLAKRIRAELESAGYEVRA